ENDWKEIKLPSKAALDKVCNKNPLVLFKKDGHSIWVNSVALKKADINEHTLDPSGGKIVRESISKTPTGILKENAIYLVLKKIKKENIEDILPTPVLNSSTTSKEIKIKNMGNIYNAVKTASKNFNKVGITSVHNMESMNRQKILFDLNSEGELNLRIYSFFEQIEPEDLYHFKRNTKLDNRWTKIGGKVIVLGVGRLGVLICSVANSLGADVIAISRSKEKLKRAKIYGALEIIDANDLNLISKVKELTNGLGADIVVESTGSENGFNLAINLVRPRGTVALKSTHGILINDVDQTKIVV
ncbi:unnamed protein product, partial [marine sediment metagenome]